MSHHLPLVPMDPIAVFASIAVTVITSALVVVLPCIGLFYSYKPAPTSPVRTKPASEKKDEWIVVAPQETKTLVVSVEKERVIPALGFRDTAVQADEGTHGEDALRAQLEEERRFYEGLVQERDDALAREEAYRNALEEARQQTDSIVQELEELTEEVEESNRREAELEAKFRQRMKSHPAVLDNKRLAQQLIISTANTEEGLKREDALKSRITDLEAQLSSSNTEMESLRFQLALQSAQIDNMSVQLERYAAAVPATPDKEVPIYSPSVRSKASIHPPTPPMTPDDAAVEPQAVTPFRLSSIHFNRPSWPPLNLSPLARSPILTPRLVLNSFFASADKKQERKREGWSSVDRVD